LGKKRSCPGKSQLSQTSKIKEKEGFWCGGCSANQKRKNKGPNSSTWVNRVGSKGIFFFGIVTLKKGEKQGGSEKFRKDQRWKLEGLGKRTNPGGSPANGWGKKIREGPGLNLESFAISRGLLEGVFCAVFVCGARQPPDGKAKGQQEEP